MPQIFREPSSTNSKSLRYLGICEFGSKLMSGMGTEFSKIRILITDKDFLEVLLRALHFRSEYSQNAHNELILQNQNFDYGWRFSRKPPESSISYICILKMPQIFEEPSSVNSKSFK